MQLFVRTVRGQTLVFETTLAATVAHVHELIERREGMPAASQRLRYAGRTLEPTARLDTSGVRREATLELVVDGRGGSLSQGRPRQAWCARCSRHPSMCHCEEGGEAAPPAHASAPVPDGAAAQATGPAAGGAETAPDTTAERKHPPGGAPQPLQPIHVEHMMRHRRARGFTRSGNSHQCPWCDRVLPNMSALREHLQRPECNTIGGSLAPYIQELGVRSWHSCSECGDVCLKPSKYLCACRTAGRTPPWSHHQTTAERGLPTRPHAQRDAQRRQQDRLAQHPGAQGMRVAQAQARPDPTPPHEVVRRFTADYVAATQYETKMSELWDIFSFFCGDEAVVMPKPEHNVDAEFLLLMEEFNKVVDGTATVRQGLPEPACAKRHALLQAQAAVALLTLPGLARRMQQARGWRTPATMKALLSGAYLAETIGRHGRAATLLDYFALPFIHEHPRAAPREGDTGTIKVETLRQLVREYKLSKAMSLARTKYDAEVRHLPTTARPTKAQIERTVADKFPDPPEDAEAIPSHADLPHQNWRTGELDLGTGTDDERAARSIKFGGKSTQLKLGTLREVLGGLSKQKVSGADTTTNTFLRRVFEDGEAVAVEAVLHPFTAMCLAGTVHPDAMAFLQASRLALVPKVDAEAAPTPPGQPPPPVDFRPLGIGGSLIRLISTAVCAQEGSAVGETLAPLQLAVRVTDGTCIMVAMAQATFTHGRRGARDCDVLKTDLKNAYGTVLRNAILRGLYKYAPRLIRWFIICYGGATKLFHSVHGFVGWVRTGVKQGDPMATILFAVALQEAIIRIDSDVRATHLDSDTARAGGFADDCNLYGDGERLLDNIVRYKDIIRDLTRMELCLHKCRLLVSSGVVTPGLREKAEAHGIKIVTEGMVVMGVPVGTDDYIRDDLQKRVGDLQRDLEALDYFTVHGQWALLRMCVNQRPVYLQRMLGLQHGTEAFARFDAEVTDKLLSIMGVHLADQRDNVRRRVAALRSLPLNLSGGAMRSIASEPTRAKMLYLCRDNIARFFKRHAERAGPMGEIVRRQWRETTLPVHTIRQATEPAPGADGGDGMAQALKGHALGGIPDASVEESTINGDPDTTDACTRPVAKRLATSRALAADLILHSRTLREMRDSEHQHDTILAAHVLSSSCANSGVVVQSAPTAAAHVPDARFRHIMRLRFGVPCAMPLDQWRCNCSAHAGPRHSAFVERVNEPNDVDIAGTFAAEPLHGLYCKRRWMRVMKRHDYIRDALCRALDRITGVRTTREPRVENPQGGGDQRRGDIRVHKDGTTWVVDIGVVCPGTAQYVGKGAATVPGKAASVYEDVKVAKYIDQSNFVPFIVETGGRVGVAGRRFLDTLVGGLVSDEGAAPDNAAGTATARLDAARRAQERKQAALRAVVWALVRQQGYMLERIVDEINAPDRAVESVVVGEYGDDGSGGGFSSLLSDDDLTAT